MQKNRIALRFERQDNARNTSCCRKRFFCVDTWKNNLSRALPFSSAGTSKGSAAISSIKNLQEQKNLYKRCRYSSTMCPKKNNRERVGSLAHIRYLKPFDRVEMQVTRTNIIPGLGDIYKSNWVVQSITEILVSKQIIERSHWITKSKTWHGRIAKRYMQRQTIRFR